MTVLWDDFWQKGRDKEINFLFEQEISVVNINLKIIISFH